VPAGVVVLEVFDVLDVLDVSDVFGVPEPVLLDVDGLGVVLVDVDVFAVGLDPLELVF
jgi:hypothetical protein